MGNLNIILELLRIYLNEKSPNQDIIDKIKFLGHLISNYDITKAQLGQDVFALWANNFCKIGYAVEFGASDGITGNNTYMLENNYGWECLLAEPNPIYHDNLEKVRKYYFSTDCVYNITGEFVQFNQVTNDQTLSTINTFGNDDEHAKKRIDNIPIFVNTITLFDMLQKYVAPKIINYISVDTEGTELVILEKFFNENNYYDVKAWTVEHNFIPDIQKNLDTLFKKNGYKRFFPEFSAWDAFYIKE